MIQSFKELAIAFGEFLSHPNALTILLAVCLAALGRHYWSQLDMKIKQCAKCEPRLIIVIRLLSEVPLRALDLRKKPSVAETLDWARALTVLNAAVLDEQVVRDTLDVILKHQGDVERAEEKLAELLAKARTAPTARA